MNAAPVPAWANNLIPAEDLPNFIASSTPTVCVVGDSTWTSDGSNQLVASEDAYHQLERFVSRANPTKTIAFPNMAIGGQLWSNLGSPSTTFNGLPWLPYIQAQNCTSLLIGLGINDADYMYIPNVVTVLSNVVGWGTASPAWQSNHAYAQYAIITDSNGRLQIATTGGTSTNGAHPTWATTPIGASTTDTGVTWKLLNTAVNVPLKPDIVFATNKNTNPAAGGAYGTTLNQAGTVAAASAERTIVNSAGAGLGISGLPPIGLLDIGRQFTSAVNGYDPARTYFVQNITTSISGVTQPYFLPAAPGGDFDVVLTVATGTFFSGFSWDLFTGGAGSQGPSIVLFALASSTLTVTLEYAQNTTTTQTATVAWNTGGTNTIEVAAKQERETITVNGTIVLDTPTARYVTPNYQPEIISYGWGGPTFTINSYNVGVPYPTNPTVPSGCWGNTSGANGNGINHDASLCINAVDVPVLEATRFAP